MYSTFGSSLAIGSLLPRMDRLASTTSSGLRQIGGVQTSGARYDVPIGPGTALLPREHRSCLTLEVEVAAPCASLLRDDYWRAKAAAASLARSMNASPLTSMTTRFTVPPRNAQGRAPGKSSLTGSAPDLPTTSPPPPSRELAGLGLDAARPDLLVADVEGQRALRGHTRRPPCRTSPRGRRGRWGTRLLGFDDLLDLSRRSCTTYFSLPSFT